MKIVVKILFIFSVGMSVVSAFAQKSKHEPGKYDYQIYLTHPAKTIHLLMYEKNYNPIQGRLSDDKKSIIIKNYEPGSKVHVRVEYEDGTIEEFVRSPCFIDPVIVMNQLKLICNYS